MTLDLRQTGDGAAPDGGAPRLSRYSASSKPVWLVVYQRNLLISDTLVVGLALLASHFIRFGTDSPEISGSELRVRVSYAVLGACLALTWLLALSLADSRNVKVFGAGAEEYRRVLIASLRIFGVLAVVAYLIGLDIARGYLAIAGPIGLCLLLLERSLWRRWLIAKRSVGGASRRTVVVGTHDDVHFISSEIAREPSAGLRVVAVCTPDGVPVTVEHGVLPSVGGVDDLLVAVQKGTLDAVVVASGGERSRETVRRLGWALEGTGASLMVVPSLTHIAGKRIHVQPVAGVPLMHVQEPRLPRGGQFLKELLDRIGAGLLILVLSPVLLIVAMAIRLTSDGPAFFCQERIGRDGTIFKVWKFRSMRVNADDELRVLLAAAGRASTPLFKLDMDPRITSVGAVLRKYSIDEIPQLFNVLAGQMSLVGPRPQRAAEVELYDDAARRRLLAKPGMTGLWQVSGRSDLAWHEAIRLDLYYVENWSFSFDLLLLWRTIWTVTRGVGAR